MGKKAELYLEYLREQGFRPRLDEDGDVVFKAEGFTLLLFAEETDGIYFNLKLPAFWPIQSEEERHRVLRTAAGLSRDLKVVKLYPADDDVWAAVEMLVDPIDSFPRVFDRALHIVLQAVREFAKQMQAS